MAEQYPFYVQTRYTSNGKILTRLSGNFRSLSAARDFFDNVKNQYVNTGFSLNCSPHWTFNGSQYCLVLGKNGMSVRVIEMGRRQFYGYH